MTVTTPGGTSAIVAADHYTYDAKPTVSSLIPAVGPIAGGNTVTISGTGFVSGAGVKFGAAASATVTFVSATQLKAVAPAHAAGTVDVTVTTPGGTSAIVAADHYTYDATPTVSSLIPGRVRLQVETRNHQRHRSFNRCPCLGDPTDGNRAFHSDDRPDHCNQHDCAHRNRPQRSQLHQDVGY